MAVKFSVSLTDEQYARFKETIKGKVSPTALFQEIVEERMNMYEERQRRRMQSMPDKDSIVERLRAEKAQAEKSLFASGEKEGEEFSKTATYEELKFAATVWANSYRPWADCSFKDCVLSQYFYELDELSGMDDNELEAWHKGWCWAVKQFWEDVATKL